MTLTLPPRLQKFLQDQVASGRFSTSDEVVAEALRQMDERENQLAKLKEEIQKGLDSGLGIEISIDEIIEQARAEMEAEQGR